MNRTIISQRLGFQLEMQHPLKSSKVRDISIEEICKLTERQSFLVFVKHRWGGLSKVVCPECGTIGRHLFIEKGKRWRCKSLQCKKFFSVLYGTSFQEKKLSYKQVLLGLHLFSIFPNGVSFETFSGLLNVQVKTSQAFIGKIREALYRDRNEEMLSGLIHMDGGHFGGRPRHGRIRRHDTETIKNHVEDMLKRKGKQPATTARANAARRIKNRRVVFVLRQLSTFEGEGAIRTIVAIGDSENEDFALSLARKYIAPGSTVMTDENPAYNQFSKYYEHHTVEHAKEFATIDGVNSNQAESYFSRLRRHVLGVAHRIEPKYMLDIAFEMAWREDVRRMTHKEKLSIILDAVFSSGRSRHWTGYWQRLNRQGELVWSPRSMKSEIRPLI